MFKKSIPLLFVITTFLFGLNYVSAQETAPVSEKTVTVTIFWRTECPHCHEALNFLDSIKPKYPELVVNKIDLNTLEGQDKFQNFTKILNLPRVTPIIQINTEVVTGFSESYGIKVEDTLEMCLKSDTQCLDFDAFIKAKEIANVTDFNKDVTCDEDDFQCKINEEPKDNKITVPYFGEIDAKTFSIPLIATVLGFIDGFNPCAMWVLIMFLTILAQTGSKKLMLQTAGLFIMAETIMYYMILNVWFTTWDFIGLDKIVTPIIAVVAIGAGFYFLYEFYKLPPGVCIIASSSEQKKTKDKIVDIVKKPLNIVTAFGIIGIAFSVNIIEFACSIGIPQTFTKILEINQLDLWKTQAMMLIYIFSYMIDDFIVFGVALYSFDKIGITEKYSKYCQFIGGVLMIVLGLILLFKREWLVF